MLFKNVVGQQHAKAGIVSMWHNGTFPHAIMIAGNEGTGGLPMAMATAQYLLCENKGETDACGQCANCSKNERMEHADVHYTFPVYNFKSNTIPKSIHFIKEWREFVKKSPYSSLYDWLQFIGAENKQGNITAAEANEIIEKLYLKSYEGGMKIQIIWRTEALGKEGNKLLKIIEEPPKDTVMILVAEDMDDVLATIKSRTQTVKLGPIANADIAAGLVENGLADAVRAAQIAQIAMGSYTEALRLIQHAENDMLPDVKKFFTAVFTNKLLGDGVEITRFADEWHKKGREQQKNLLFFMVHLVEQAIKFRYLPSSIAQLGQQEADFVKNLAGRNIPDDSLFKMAGIAGETIHLIERNAYSKAQLHAMAIRMRYVLTGKENTVYS